MPKKSKPLPLISREEFAAQIDFIEKTRQKFEKLCDVMESLAEGFRVDFFPNLSFETKIVDLLNIIMHENPEDSLIEYYIYETNFGEDHARIQFKDKQYNIGTSELLYDALLEINFGIKPTPAPEKPIKEKDEDNNATK